MKKKPSSLFNLLFSLGLISLIAGLCLSVVYIITKEPIAAAQLEKQVAALKIVLPEFDNEILDSEVAEEIDGGEIYIYTAFKDDVEVGKAINTFSKNGFGGEIRFMVGILPDGKINGISLLSHAETPGLGDKLDANKSDFIEKVLAKYDKNPETFVFKVSKDKNGGDVDAITAATISSRAFCEAITKVQNTVKN
jgi:electron transport complex protein RnfG